MGLFFQYPNWIPNSIDGGAPRPALGLTMSRLLNVYINKINFGGVDEFH